MTLAGLGKHLGRKGLDQIASIAKPEIILAWYRSADHGPVFGLAKPTNPKGGWSLNLAVNGRSGTASNLEGLLSYGVTQNLKLSVSGPVVFRPVSGRTVANLPMGESFRPVEVRSLSDLLRMPC